MFDSNCPVCACVCVMLGSLSVIRPSERSKMKMYGGPVRPDAEVDNGLVKISVVQCGCFL